MTGETNLKSMNKMENGMENVDILQNIFRPRWFRLKIMPSTDRMRCPETETMKPAIFCCNLWEGAASAKKNTYGWEANGWCSPWCLTLL